VKAENKDIVCTHCKTPTEFPLFVCAKCIKEKGYEDPTGKRDFPDMEYLEKGFWGGFNYMITEQDKPVEGKEAFDYTVDIMQGFQTICHYMFLFHGKGGNTSKSNDILMNEFDFMPSQVLWLLATHFGYTSDQLQQLMKMDYDQVMYNMSLFETKGLLQRQKVKQKGRMSAVK
jgi:hypothetical protein